MLSAQAGLTPGPPALYPLGDGETGIYHHTEPEVLPFHACWVRCWVTEHGPIILHA